MQTKEVTVSGRKYKIEQMTPFLAGRVYGWLKGAIIQFARKETPTNSAPDVRQLTPEEQKEAADGSVKYSWALAPSNISEEACEKIQRYALQQCKYFDAATQAPCDLLVGGQIADAALREDGPGVDALIVESLKFSISPFFLKELLEMTQTAPAK